MSIDPNSATWEAVKAHVEKALEGARSQLEASGLGLPETEYVRGQIKALTGVLDLTKVRPRIESTDPAY